MSYDVPVGQAARPTTTVDPIAIAAAGDRLIGAHRAGAACQPVRDLIGREDVAAAYLVQERFNATRSAAGARVVGRKIGVTSEAVQQQLGVDQPDFGVLFDDMEIASDEVIPVGRLIQPKVEAEVAFVLRDDLAEGPLDRDQIRGAVAYAVAALEIVDSRIRDWDISFADTVADNASAGLFVLGDHRRALTDFDPRDATMAMRIDGNVVATGDGAACLGDPLRALAWLAHQARTFGEPLRAGQVVLSGALGPMRPVTPGSLVVAEIGALGLIDARFGSENDAESETQA